MRSRAFLQADKAESSSETFLRTERKCSEDSNLDCPNRSSFVPDSES